MNSLPKCRQNNKKLTISDLRKLTRATEQTRKSLVQEKGLTLSKPVGWCHFNMGCNCSLALPWGQSADLTLWSSVKSSLPQSIFCLDLQQPGKSPDLTQSWAGSRSCKGWQEEANPGALPKQQQTIGNTSGPNAVTTKAVNLSSTQNVKGNLGAREDSRTFQKLRLFSRSQRLCSHTRPCTHPGKTWEGTGHQSFIPGTLGKRQVRLRLDGMPPHNIVKRKGL